MAIMLRSFVSCLILSSHGDKKLDDQVVHRLLADKERKCAVNAMYVGRVGYPKKYFLHDISRLVYIYLQIGTKEKKPLTPPRPGGFNPNLTLLRASNINLIRDPNPGTPRTVHLMPRLFTAITPPRST